jgi:hypothetical protein
MRLHWDHQTFGVVITNRGNVLCMVRPQQLLGEGA